MHFPTLNRCAPIILLLFAPLTRAQSYGPYKAEWTTPIAPFRIADNLTTSAAKTSPPTSSSRRTATSSSTPT